MDQPISPNQAVAAPTRSELSSINDLISEAIKIYTAGFKKLIGLQLVAFLGALPLIIIFLIFGATTFFHLDATAMSVVRVILGLLGIISFFVVIIVSLSAQIGQMLLLNNFSLDKKVWDLFKEARPLVWGFFVVSLIVGVIVCLGFIALIIPGIYLALTYSFAAWAYVVENKKGIEALKRSKELTNGYKWGILVRGAVIYLIVFIISWIFAIPQKAFGDNAVFVNVWNAILNIIQMIIAPFFLIYFYLIFKDLIAIKGAANK